MTTARCTHMSVHYASGEEHRVLSTHGRCVKCGVRVKPAGASSDPRKRIPILEEAIRKLEKEGSK